jgi:hypothetical protein
MGRLVTTLLAGRRESERLKAVRTKNEIRERLPPQRGAAGTALSTLFQLSVLPRQSPPAASPPNFSQADKQTASVSEQPEEQISTKQ